LGILKIYEDDEENKRKEDENGFFRTEKREAIGEW